MTKIVVETQYAPGTLRPGWSGPSDPKAFDKDGVPLWQKRQKTVRKGVRTH